MTLVELLIAAGVIVLVFGGLLVTFELLVRLIGVAKAETGALALANERIEYLRSLPYDSVGTVGGIPEGTIPQNTTRTLNGVTYNERVLIQYIDAPEDGEGGSDVNGILADYKLAKVEYTWDQRGEERTVSLLSNIVPRGIETTAGGGTLTVNVFNAAVLPVEGAEVHLYNDTGTTTVDTVRYTNVAGVAMFAGAPARANYEITVTKDAYSTDGTYGASGANPNPNPPHVAVIESEVSTMNFQIDLLADAEVATVGIPTIESFEDTFSSGSDVVNATNVTVSGGAVVLTGAPGTYAGNGSLQSTAVAPAIITMWNSGSFETALPSNTEIRAQVYTVAGTSTYALVSDTDLPGNSAGFTTSPIDISTLNPATHPSLAVGAILSSSDAMVTPELLSWELSYTISEPPIANVPFTLTSQKSIGTGADASPVPKFENAYTTDGSGERDIPDLEWGTYNLSLDTISYDIAEACPFLPLTLSPGGNVSLKLTLAPDVARSLLVEVEDVSGTPVAGAEIQLTRTGVNETLSTSACGQSFFNDRLPSAIDYTLEISKSGYTTEILTDVAIEENEIITVVLTTP